MPSLLNPPTDNDYASPSTSPLLDSVLDTPSRSPRRHEGDCNDAADPNNDTHTHTETEVNDSTVVTILRQEKLGVIVETLRKTKWSFQDMIKAWVGAHGLQDI